jgi:hypothetical protein
MKAAARLPLPAARTNDASQGDRARAALGELRLDAKKDDIIPEYPYRGDQTT